MPPLLELQGVSAGYGARAVLEGVSFEVRAGEAWVVLGPNGAGKSTVVRAVMGLLSPAAGRVSLLGRNVASMGARTLAAQLAWVPQTTADDTGFTGLELTLMGRAPHRSAWGAPSATDTQQALAVMAELGVEHLAHRALAEVSGGERRRVWLARALVQAPRVLVLDEPTAFLDIKHQVETLAAVRRRLTLGLGVLAVLHDVNLAQHLATHVLLLKEGRVLAQGPVEDVLTDDILTSLFDIPMVPAVEAQRVFVPRWS
jgi:iron complex transport system ATP-binding protein